MARVAFPLGVVAGGTKVGYRCEICSKAFSSTKELRAHNQKAHGSKVHMRYGAKKAPKKAPM